MKIAALSIALFLTGCAALDSIVPASQADLNERIEAQSEYQAQAARAADEGRAFDAILYSIGAAVTAVGAGVGLSRRRRKEEIAKATLAKSGATAS